MMAFVTHDNQAVVSVTTKELLAKMLLENTFTSLKQHRTCISGELNWLLGHSP